MKAAIGYLRVSTPEQGRSGIGLAAQRAEIEAFGNGAGFAIKFWHQDIHTGAGRDALLLRPSLKAALKQAASEKCPLIVSRLDRLSRNVHFITGLREHGVHFIVARFGRDLEDFVLHIYASIAQQERKMLADRVNAGLAAAKARGIKLGQARRSKTEQRRCSQLAAISTSNAAMARAQVYRPHIEAVLQQPGIRSRRITYQGAADQLNRSKIASPSGDWWRWSQVRYLSIRFGLRRRLSKKGRRLISAPRLQPWPLRRALRRTPDPPNSPRAPRRPAKSGDVVLPPITNIVTAIAYLRVSTQEQDRRGFGLGTQRAEIEDFARKEKLSILSWHQDIQTGAGSDALLLRPGLAAALKEAKARRCPLIVSRLDRLSRSVHFISGLMELRVHFMVAALGKLHDNFTLHIWASLAEQERKLISERVRAAAAIQKFRGVKMGQAGRTKEHQLRICALAHAGRQRAAMDRAEAHRPHIEWALRQPGIREADLASRCGPETKCARYRVAEGRALGG